MDLSTFVVAIFCLVDDWLRGGSKLRQRGPEPTLSDSEVLTMEIVGEFLGIDSEKGLYDYFRRLYGEWFPALRGTLSAPPLPVRWPTCGSPRRDSGESCCAGSASTLRSPWWTPSRCPFAGSPGPTAARAWPRNRPSATTR